LRAGEFSIVIAIYAMTAGIVWAINPRFMRTDERWHDLLSRFYNIDNLDIERIRRWIRIGSLLEAVVFGCMFIVTLVLN
jgi:hypothetical protein